MEDKQNQAMPQDPINLLLGEFSIKINEIEEKQRLIKDRLLLVGENLIETKQEIEIENSEFKKEIKEISNEIKTIKQILKRVVGELSNFARKGELEILERQSQMFQPLEFVRMKEIKKIIQDELKNQLNKQNKTIKKKKS